MTRLSLIFKNFFKSKSTYGLLLCVFGFVIFILFYTSLPFEPSISWKENESELIVEKSSPAHTLCVLVPFRDVFEELLEFVPHISEFLNRQSISYHIVVIDQVPNENRFNRGATFNAGFEIISEVYPDCDYVALHDVDLLPLNEELSYAYPGEDEVTHIANPDYHPLGQLYIRNLYIGGIALISNQLFTRVNGFGNDFWGWGMEDQNFSVRLKRKFIKVNRFANLSTDRTNTFRHIHGKSRIRDTPKCLNQISAAYATPDFVTGLNNVKYEITFEHSITIDGFPLSVYGINIPCDFDKTPWCKPLCRLTNDTTKQTDLLGN